MAAVATFAEQVARENGRELAHFSSEATLDPDTETMRVNLSWFERGASGSWEGRRATLGPYSPHWLKPELLLEELLAGVRTVLQPIPGT